MKKLKKIKDLTKGTPDFAKKELKLGRDYLKSWYKDYFIGFFKIIDQKHIFFYASALTFDLILCIIPFIFIIFSYLGSLLKSQEVINQVFLLIDNLIPNTSYSADIKGLVSDRIAEFIEYKTIAGVIGIVGVLITCAGLFGSMRTILNSIFNIKENKSFLVAKLRDLGMVAIVILFFYVMLLFNPIVEIAKKIIVEPDFVSQSLLSFISSWVLDLIIMLITFIFFFIIFSLIPYEKISSKVSLISSLWATLLYEIAKYIFSYYVNTVNYNRIYGSFTFLIIVALWFYFSSIIFISSAIIGQLFRERKKLLETFARKDITLKQIYSPVTNQINKTIKSTKKIKFHKK